MAWPTNTITTVHLDSATDDPSQARPEILNAMQLVSAIIAGAVTSASANTVVLRDANADIFGRRFKSNIATGVAPLLVVSTTKVDNLNADKVDGYDFNQSVQVASTPTFAGLTLGSTGLTTDGTALRTKILTITDWDMTGGSFKNVSHGLTFANIRSVQVLITNDATTFTYSLEYDSTAAAGRFIISPSVISVFSHSGGFFDSAAFNATGTTRGRVIVTYEA